MQHIKNKNKIVAAHRGLSSLYPGIKFNFIL